MTKFEWTVLVSEKLVRRGISGRGLSRNSVSWPVISERLRFSRGFDLATRLSMRTGELSFDGDGGGVRGKVI